MTVKNKTFQLDLALVVDAGEASAIALAHEIENDFLITDDMQARKLAVKLGLTVTGTLGLLLMAKQNGLISLVSPYLEKIKLTNFRLDKNIFEFVLDKAGER